MGLKNGRGVGDREKKQPLFGMNFKATISAVPRRRPLCTLPNDPGEGGITKKAQLALNQSKIFSIERHLLSQGCLKRVGVLYLDQRWTHPALSTANQR